MVGGEERNARKVRETPQVAYHEDRTRNVAVVWVGKQPTLLPLVQHNGCLAEGLMLGLKCEKISVDMSTRVGSPDSFRSMGRSKRHVVF